MSQVKLAAAKELIQEQKYIEARALLLTIQDDSTAKKWIVQLDERIAKMQPPPSDNYPLPQSMSALPLPPTYEVVPTNQRRRRETSYRDPINDELLQYVIAAFVQ